MRFQVPQFIEVEDKIFGPLTFKQFVYIAGGIGLAILFWLIIPWKLLALPFVGLALALGGTLSFLKINNKPFVDILRSAVYYALNHKLYIWKKAPPKIVEKAAKAEAVPDVYVPKLSSSRLKEISWSLDVEDLSNSNSQSDGNMEEGSNLRI